MYGTFIKRARLSRRLTQVELAGIVGIEQPNLSAYENDRQTPSADALNRILAGCGYLLEATAGDQRIVCPAQWGLGLLTSISDRNKVQLLLSGRLRSINHRDDEVSAVKLEQVLALADSIRWAKTAS